MFMSFEITYKASCGHLDTMTTSFETMADDLTKFHACDECAPHITDEWGTNENVSAGDQMMVYIKPNRYATCHQDCEWIGIDEYIEDDYASLHPDTIVSLYHWNGHWQFEQNYSPTGAYKHLLGKEPEATKEDIFADVPTEADDIDFNGPWYDLIDPATGEVIAASLDMAHLTEAIETWLNRSGWDETNITISRCRKVGEEELAQQAREWDAAKSFHEVWGPFINSLDF